MKTHPKTKIKTSRP